MTTHQVLHVLHTLHTTCLGHLSCSPISATSQKQTNQPKSSQENTDRVTANEKRRIFRRVQHHPFAQVQEALLHNDGGRAGQGASSSGRGQ